MSPRNSGSFNWRTVLENKITVVLQQNLIENSVNCLLFFFDIVLDILGLLPFC